MKRDANHLAVTTTSDEAIEAINQFTHELSHNGKNADRILKAAENFPDVMLVQCYAAAFHLYAQTDANTLLAATFLQKAEELLESAKEREKLFYYSLLAWKELDYEKALTLLFAIAKGYPQDIAAIKIAEWLFYCSGQAYHARRFLSLCNTAKRHHHNDSAFLAIYAFALELCGYFAKSYETALEALEIDPLTPWAHHALAHVYMMQGQMDRGIKALEAYKPTWESILPLLKGHNTWHLGLLYLAELKTDQAAKLYSQDIWGGYPNSVLQQMDSISFLWRMEMAGIPQAGNWQAIAKHISNYPYEHYMPYNNAHYVYALIRAGNRDGALRVIDNIDTDADRLGTIGHKVWHTVSKPLLQGCLSFAEEDYQRASTLLRPIIKDAFCVGGSDAQVELFWQTYLLSLIHSNQGTEAKSFFNQYLSHYKSTPLGELWLAKI